MTISFCFGGFFSIKCFKSEKKIQVNKNNTLHLILSLRKKKHYIPDKDITVKGFLSQKINDL
jgi:hypothetical protein